MSTGLECDFVWLANAGPDGEWFYILQDWNCPVGAWDWHEYATAYGPFPSEQAANEHLNRNHANPGGMMVDVAPRDPKGLNPAMHGLIAEARKRGTRRW